MVINSNITRMEIISYWPSRSNYQPNIGKIITEKKILKNNIIYLGIAEHCNRNTSTLHWECAWHSEPTTYSRRLCRESYQRQKWGVLHEIFWNNNFQTQWLITRVTLVQVWAYVLEVVLFHKVMFSSVLCTSRRVFSDSYYHAIIYKNYSFINFQL